MTLPVTFFYDILRMNEYIPGGLRSASLHSGPSHCILRPANAGLVSSGPLPLPVSAGAHASGGYIHSSERSSAVWGLAPERPVHPRTGAGGGAHWKQVIAER